MTEKEFIKAYKEKNPIMDCLGCGGGRWKYHRYLDGIDLRYGYDSKKSAEMARAKEARLAWADEVYQNAPQVCSCGKTTTRRVMDAVGMCAECADKKYSF